MSRTDTTQWWRYHIDAFSALLALCVGNSPVTGEFPSQKASNADLCVSLMLVCITILTNSRMTGDLRLHDVHVISSITHVPHIYELLSCLFGGLWWDLKLVSPPRWHSDVGGWKIESISIIHSVNNLCNFERNVSTVSWSHDRQTGSALLAPLWGESTGHRWI